MVSSGWCSVEIRRLGKVVTGRTPSSARPELFGDALPFLTPTDMNGGRRIENPERRLSLEGAQVFRRLIVDHAVAVSCIGWQLGKVILIDEPSLTNQQINSIVVGDASVDRKFLYYALLLMRDQIFRLASGGSRTPIISKSAFEKLPVLVPPRRIQEAISGFLSWLDDKIELNHRMNQTLEAMARAIFKSWFVDFEPTLMGGTSFGGPFYSSGLGPIPQGWAWRPLDSIADFMNGLALQKFPPSDEGYIPVIKIADLRRGDTENSERAGLDVPNNYVVENGTVLFSWSGTLEVVVWTGGCGALNQHIFKVSAINYPKWFYLYWLKEYLPSFRAIAADKATTMGHIQRRHLTEALVAVPPEKVLEAMNQKMAPLLEKQIQNSLESKTLATIRDALLPKLLSGKIRVKHAEKIVGEVV